MGHLFGKADAARLPLADRSVDLVLGSPPYCDARTYGIDAQRDVFEWVDWMLRVTEEALRVTRGAVIWVAAGVTRERRYQPAVEGLAWEGFRRGWAQECPVYWRRVGIPGSGGDQWFRKDIEYCLCFKREPKLPWSDNTARGHAPKFGPGGEMSNRMTAGRRVNQWGATEKSGSQRQADGTRQKPGRPSHRFGAVGGRRKNGTSKYLEDWAGGGYEPPTLANPGNLLDTGASGGNNLGHAIAHENEAPYPEDVPDFFIAALCPPGGTVLDPFSGSGTTVAVADRLGRNGIGLDLRESQGRLGIQRLTRPHAPVAKRGKREEMPLFQEIEG